MDLHLEMPCDDEINLGVLRVLGNEHSILSDLLQRSYLCEAAC